MNISALLHRADKEGLPQCAHAYRNPTFGYCAAGAILHYSGEPDDVLESPAKAADRFRRRWRSSKKFKCPKCESRESLLASITHLNDAHRMTFREIAGVVRGREKSGAIRQRRVASHRQQRTPTLQEACP